MEKLKQFYNYLIEENKKQNLTRITDWDDFFEKHYLDSIEAEQFIEKNANVLDVGVGAGFPSIPLKLVRDDLNILMLDSLKKRCEYLERVIELLELKRIMALHTRIEDFSAKEVFDVVVSRAVAPLPTLLEYLAPFAKIGGLVICYKSENERAENAEKILGLEIEKVHQYKDNRFLLIYRKTKETPSFYPRAKNLPRLKPL